MTWAWVGFFVVIVGLLALDLGVFHRGVRAMGVREAAAWTLFWIALSLAFNGLVYLIYQHDWFGAALASGEPTSGAEAATRFFTGYLLEKALSVDNIFVIALLFRQFRIEPRYQHRVLFWGIVGALIGRTVMIVVGVWLVTRFAWLFYFFGGYLAYAGLRVAFAREEKTFDAQQSRLMNWIYRVLPVTSADHGGHFVIRVEGRLKFTRLALALVVIEFTDVVFALDSVPAVLAITTDTFVVLTSNIFAILGLRALYFVLASMITKFRYLQLALAVVLVVIGAKMIAHSWLEIPTWLSLVVIGSCILFGALASLIAVRHY